MIALDLRAAGVDIVHRFAELSENGSLSQRKIGNSTYNKYFKG